MEAILAVLRTTFQTLCFLCRKKCWEHQIANTKTALLTKILFNPAFLQRISSSGHISISRTRSRKEMLTLKQKETVMQNDWLSQISAEMEAHAASNITPRSSTGHLMSFTAVSVFNRLRSSKGVNHILAEPLGVTGWEIWGQFLQNILYYKTWTLCVCLCVCLFTFSEATKTPTFIKFGILIPFGPI